MSQQDCIVAVVSDLHSGSTVGLCPPIVTLDDGGEYRQSRAQGWLWENWLDFWRRMGQLKKDTRLPLVVIINGDLVDGDHHNTSQIITRNPNTQIDIALEVLEPLRWEANAIFETRGTEVHTGGSGWVEERVAKEIGTRSDEANGTHSFWHLLAEFGGVLFDIAHHPETTSRLPHTKGADSNRIAAMLIMEYGGRGERIPNVALRGHIHSFRDSGTTHGSIRVFTTPAWQLTTGFGHRIGAGGKLQKPGGFYFICRQGHYIFEPVFYTPERPRPVTVEFRTTKKNGNRKQ